MLKGGIYISSRLLVIAEGLGSIHSSIPLLKPTHSFCKERFCPQISLIKTKTNNNKKILTNIKVKCSPSELPVETAEGLLDHFLLQTSFWVQGWQWGCPWLQRILELLPSSDQTSELLCRVEKVFPHTLRASPGWDVGCWPWHGFVWDRKEPWPLITNVTRYLSPGCHWAISDSSFLTALWHFNPSVLPQPREQGKGILFVCGNQKK